VLDTYIAAIKEKGYSLVAFLPRVVFENATSYSEALELLSTTKL